jgi:heme oxygenase (biliverdin-producing, ferredoxin)
MPMRDPLRPILLSEAAPARLSELLRVRTRAHHVRAERAAMMQALIHGRVDRVSYCTLLRNLHPIYREMEGGLAAHATHPWLAPLRIGALERRGPLEEDLDVLYGTHWRQSLPLMPATLRYERRLAELGRLDPRRLLAHAYLRYLGDLSGGQILSRAIARGLGLDGARGTSFYAFGAPAVASRLAERFRAGLDALPADGAGAQDVVEEAQFGFDLHAELFAQLDAACTGRAPGEPDGPTAAFPARA